MVGPGPQGLGFGMHVGGRRARAPACTRVRARRNRTRISGRATTWPTMASGRQSRAVRGGFVCTGQAHV
eukprot:6731584-Prymnesium_polylepis.1